MKREEIIIHPRIKRGPSVEYPGGRNMGFASRSNLVCAKVSCPVVAEELLEDGAAGVGGAGAVVGFAGCRSVHPSVHQPRQHNRHNEKRQHHL